MMNKKVISLIMAVLLSLTLFGCSGADDTANKNSEKEQIAAKPEFNLRFSHVNDPSHPFHLGGEKFAELVEEKTNSGVKINIFPSGQLGSHRDLLESMQAGTIDFDVLSTGPLANWVPEIGVLDLPYLFTDEQEAYKVLDSEAVKQLVKPLEEHGLKVIAFWAAGFRNVTNNVKPINSVEDMKDLKIRVMEAPVYIDLMRSWKANPTPMAFGEVYTALQQGVIDGQENYVSSIASNRLYEVQKYVAMTKHTYSAAPVVMSLKTWEKLPSEYQEALTEAIQEATVYQRGVEDQKHDEFLQMFNEKGVNITEPDLASFEEAAKVVWEKYGPDFQKWIDEFEKIK
ncbi:MAG: TRAP transporter substrate-binding protein [Peptococcaceae bacterium]